jgi:hypothetical protein
LNCNGPDLIYQYVIGPGGALSPQTPPTLPIPSRAASFAQAGTFLYESGHDEILPFKIGAYGSLTPLAGVSSAGSTLSIAVDPSGQFLYTPVILPISPVSIQLLTYSINVQTGALTSVPGAPITTPNEVNTGVAPTFQMAFATVTTKPDCPTHPEFCLNPPNVFQGFCAEHLASAHARPGAVSRPFP